MNAINYLQKSVSVWNDNRQHFDATPEEAPETANARPTDRLSTEGDYNIIKYYYYNNIIVIIISFRFS